MQISFLLLPVSIEAQFSSVSAAVELTDGGAPRLIFFSVIFDCCMLFLVSFFESSDQESRIHGLNYFFVVIFRTRPPGVR